MDDVRVDVADGGRVPCEEAVAEVTFEVDFGFGLAFVVGVGPVDLPVVD